MRVGVSTASLFNRKNNEDAEIIVVSPNESPIRERKAMSKGAFAYLRRPLAAATFDTFCGGVINQSPGERNAVGIGNFNGITALEFSGNVCHACRKQTFTGVDNGVEGTGIDGQPS